MSSKADSNTYQDLVLTKKGGQIVSQRFSSYTVVRFVLNQRFHRKVRSGDRMVSRSHRFCEGKSRGGVRCFSLSEGLEPLCRNSDSSRNVHTRPYVSL